MYINEKCLIASLKDTDMGHIATLLVTQSTYIKYMRAIKKRKMTVGRKTDSHRRDVTKWSLFSLLEERKF